MPPFASDPDVQPLTQAELDALSAEQQAMGATVPAGGYVAQPPPPPTPPPYDPAQDTQGMQAQPAPITVAPPVADPTQSAEASYQQGQYTQQIAQPGPEYTTQSIYQPAPPSPPPVPAGSTFDALGSAAQQAGTAALKAPWALWDWREAHKYVPPRLPGPRHIAQPAAYPEGTFDRVPATDWFAGTIPYRLATGVPAGEILPRLIRTGHEGRAGAENARRMRQAQDDFGAWLAEHLGR